MKKKCLKYVGFEYFPCEIFYIQFHPSDDTKLLQKDFTKFDYEETEFLENWSHKENGTGE